MATIYPASTLALVKGKWHVSVTVPRELRVALNGQKQIKRSTGTSDQKVAKTLQHDITAVIYAKFDAANPNPLKEALRQLAQAQGDKGIKIIPSIVDHLEDDNWEIAEEAAMHLDEVRRLANYYQMTEDFTPKGSASDAVLAAIESHGKSQQTRPTFSAVADDFIADGQWSSSTLSYTKKAVSEFCAIFPDILLSDIKKVQLYDYAQVLAEEGLANNTIKGRFSRLSGIFRYCERKGLLEKNPIIGMRLTDYGKSGQRWKPFTPAQLTKIFAQNIPPQERLLMSILITTGMRLDEAALLQWDQYKVDDEGLPYFDLTEAKTKNEGSRRKVPVVPQVQKLMDAAERTTTRIFNYKLNRLGKTIDASIILMRYIRNVTDDPFYVNHSYRGTLKGKREAEAVHVR